MIKTMKLIMWLGMLLFAPVMSAIVTPDPIAPNVVAKSYILQDFTSGRIIAGNNIDERLPPASITKLMTAYVVAHELQAGNTTMDDEVVISEKVWRMTGSQSFLEIDTKVPVAVLLRGMIIQSGNDAAVALAEHVAGGEETFVQMMNQYAQLLGMSNTNYRNSTGLPDSEHYTSARDIAILAATIIRDFPQYYRWYSEKEFTYNGIRQPNRNKLLWRDVTVDGIKTGHTQEAGYCLAASAKRGDMRLISVVLGTRSDNVRVQETQKLLNYGFRFFESHKMYEAKEKIVDAGVWKGAQKQVQLGLDRPLFISVTRGRYKKLVTKMHINEPLIAPIIAGEQLGEIQIHFGDELIAERPLVVLQAVEEGSWWRRVIDTILMKLRSIFGEWRLFER